MTVRFVAYVDESGDTGLQNIKPSSPKGASEWLVLSCFLVRQEEDNKCLAWVKETLSKFKNNIARNLHFADLIPAKKIVACQDAASRPGRYFIVASNKKNIENYENEAAATVSGNTGTAWLYWWLTRLLLERVTNFCEARVPLEERGLWKLRIIFSRRGGLRYVDFERYLHKLYWQSTFEKLELKQGDLCWSVVDFEEIFVLDHSARAGLQLADIGAGAFFNALEQNRPANCDTQFAKLLDTRVARDPNGHALGYGIKTMPALHQMGLSDEQKQIFEHFGYPTNAWNKWWAPGS